MDGVTIIETAVFQELLSKIDAIDKRLQVLDQDLREAKKPYLTVVEVAELTGFTTAWVNGHKQDIGYSNIGRNLRFKRKDVEELIEEGYFKIPKKRNRYKY